ncbi:hypothetical protein B0O80DRAFT_169169 [Mortierella sp. GBAus27b]|nr:hypothetical protein BGX31_000578 [Mortierella sp. GBA43]KAI8349062.1 hypothetical protein B0O80DRAFT_169169 [Mortierella sp. GBAus27b]
MSAKAGSGSIQEFRHRSSGEVVRITTRIDPRSGEPVVLWSDIQSGIKNAGSIWNGNLMVSFLTDGSLAQSTQAQHERIIPLRIVYHPNVVLEVDDRSQLNNETTLLDVPHSQDLSHNTPIQPTTSIPAVATTFAHSDTDSDSLVAYPDSTDGLISSSLTAPSPLHNTLIRNTLSTQVATQANTQQSMNQQPDGLGAEMDKNRELQVQLARLQLLQQQTSDQLVQDQEEMKEMHNAALDRPTIIQGRMQAVITRTYELHECPIPRLFIVLPKAATVVFSKNKSPNANQFRLYFLCECGSHTMDDNSKTQHEIHLAKHEGYDLEKPTEFFEKYGSYVLTLMYTIKYGVNAAGLVVPPLPGLKIVDGVDTAQRHMDYIKGNLSLLVDSTINFLEGIKAKKDQGEVAAKGHAESNQLEALEGEDLRQLESYLILKDQSRATANLYRIVTSEGHARWVCFDHYRTTCHESAIRELREHGAFIEETSRIEIVAINSALAKQFYDVMIRVHGIQELDIVLTWDVTMDDLQTLSSAIIVANVADVTLDGFHPTDSQLDVVHSNQRFNPILQFVSSSRIQSLWLRGFNGLFSSITKSALAPSPQLRVFKYDATLSDDDDIQGLGDFLRSCSSLTTLELTLPPHQPIMEIVSEIVRMVPTLKSLKIKCNNMSIKAVVADGRTQDVDLAIMELRGPTENEFMAMRKEHLTRMSIADISGNGVDQLEEILRGASSLKELRVGCVCFKSLEFIDCVISTRAKIIQETGSSCLRTFELMERYLVPFNPTCYVRRDHIQSYISFQEEGSNLFDMRTWIRCIFEVSLEFARRYGWSIVHYNGKIPTEVPPLELLNGFGDTKTPQLESLWIRPRFAEIDIVEQIIQRSPNFKDLGLYVNLDEEGDFRAAQTLLSRHRHILSVLWLQNNPSAEQWSWFASSLPTRSSLPALESFTVVLPPNFELPWNCISWIVAMVSAPPHPPQELLTSGGQPIITRGVVDEYITPVELVAQGSWTLLKRIGLYRLRLETEDWKSVMEAIDFSGLEVLSFYASNLSVESLELLVDRIPDDPSNVPLMNLDVKSTALVRSVNAESFPSTEFDEKHL